MLTDAKLRKLKGKPCDKRYELSDAAGLSVRITPAGMIVFQFRYQYNGVYKNSVAQTRTERNEVKHRDGRKSKLMRG